MTNITKDDLVGKIEQLATGRDRFVVAISGPPGSGKSTLANYLAVCLRPKAAVLPMDGFHFENDVLTQKGLLHRKGAPETFDAERFVALVRSLQSAGNIPYPTFDRSADRTVPGGGSISEDTTVVLVEGNYLLLNQRPWSNLAVHFDLRARLKVERDELLSRLVQRWLDQGMPEDEARARAIGNDMRNVDLVEANSRSPDLWVPSETQ